MTPPVAPAPDPREVTVAGRFDRSLADFERACLVHIDEEQRRAHPDNALIALLCDAVRLTREQELRPLPVAPDLLGPLEKLKNRWQEDAQDGAFHSYIRTTLRKCIKELAEALQTVRVQSNQEPTPKGVMPSEPGNAETHSTHRGPSEVTAGAQHPATNTAETRFHAGCNITGFEEWWKQFGANVETLNPEMIAMAGFDAGAHRERLQDFHDPSASRETKPSGEGTPADPDPPQGTALDKLEAADTIQRALLREVSEIIQIVYAGNFPAGIESFLVRADRAIKSESFIAACRHEQAELQAENATLRTEVAEKAAIIKASGFEHDELRARAGAAEARRDEALHRATRIQLDKELLAENEHLKAQLAALLPRRAELQAENAKLQEMLNSREQDCAAFCGVTVRIFKALGVDREKHAIEAIEGLQARVRFTESFESLQLAALLPRRAEAWQPIETAPKDGSMILVHGGVAHWFNGDWYTLTGCEYPGVPIHWLVKHWQPMPAPPADASRETE